jgi:predicted nuclease of predicted toxin-antitoxin system
LTRQAPRSAPLRFLFDEHVHAEALRELQNRGVDAVGVSDVGLQGADDPDLFGFAGREGRIIVTRNYRDFAVLAEEAARQGLPFPGVLFLAPSIPQSDPGAHVRALEAWIRRAEAEGGSPVSGSFGWLGAGG